MFAPQTPAAQPTFRPAQPVQTAAPPMFTGMRDVRASNGTPFLTTGHYWLLLNKLRTGKNHLHEQFVVADFTCLRLLSGTDASIKPGAECSHMFMQKHASAAANLKNLLVAASGFREEEIDEEFCLVAVSDQNPLAGIVVEANAREITTRQNKPFTKITYSRAVPPAELKLALLPEEQAHFFPPGFLDS